MSKVHLIEISLILAVSVTISTIYFEQLLNMKPLLLVELFIVTGIVVMVMYILKGTQNNF